MEDEAKPKTDPYDDLFKANEIGDANIDKENQDDVNKDNQDTTNDTVVE